MRAGLVATAWLMYGVAVLAAPGADLPRPVDDSACAAMAAAALRGASGPPASLTGRDQVASGGGEVLDRAFTESDLPALPGVLGLELVRHAGLPDSADVADGFGPGWRLGYETVLRRLGTERLVITQADGELHRFSCASGRPRVCRAATAVLGHVVLDEAGARVSATWVWPDGRRLAFDGAGRLVQILAPTGEFVTLQRDGSGRLLEVTDPQGRSLRIVYGPSGLGPGRAAAGLRIASIDTPVGRFRYEYGSASAPDGVLVKVSIPTHYEPETKVHAFADRGVSASSLSRVYHHEDARLPMRVTGISVTGTRGDGRLVNERVDVADRTDPEAARKRVGPPPATMVPGTGMHRMACGRDGLGKPTAQIDLDDRGRLARWRYVNPAEALRWCGDRSAALAWSYRYRERNGRSLLSTVAAECDGREVADVVRLEHDERGDFVRVVDLPGIVTLTVQQRDGAGRALRVTGVRRVPATPVDEARLQAERLLRAIGLSNESLGLPSRLPME